jgi:hypothetical protein
MTSVGLKACVLACVFVAIALAQSVSIPPMDHLKASETLRAAKLSSTEIKQICEQVETTSFDVPDSWEKELRGQRVSLGNEDGLVIQGTELLCGGTGNCQTWVLRRIEWKVAGDVQRSGANRISVRLPAGSACRAQEFCYCSQQLGRYKKLHHLPL